MALTKEVVIDQITVLEDGQMQVREVTRIMEDGVELSKSYHRHVVSPGDDLTKEDAKVAEVGTVVHTEQVKDDFKAKQDADKLGEPSEEVAEETSEEAVEEIEEEIAEEPAEDNETGLTDL
jgi:arginine utilization protein RocB